MKKLFFAAALLASSMAWAGEIRVIGAIQSVIIEPDGTREIKCDPFYQDMTCFVITFLTDDGVNGPVELHVENQLFQGNLLKFDQIESGEIESFIISIGD